MADKSVPSLLLLLKFRFVFLLLLALALAVLLASCGGGNNSSTFQPGNQPAPTPPTPELQPSRFLYSIWGFEPEGVDAGAIKATIAKGVLIVTVPKPAPAQAKTIEVKTAA